MSAPKERLLIKLVTGRMLIDTAVSGQSFQVEEMGRGWRITVQDFKAADAAYLKANIDQLNFFYFVSLADEPDNIQKYWLYDLKVPLFEYDETNGTAAFELDSKVAYSNERV